MVYLGHVSARGHDTDFRVLLVDDELHVRRAFQRSLRPLEITVDVAGNATQALRLVAQHRYGVIATDVAMPGLDGIDLAERLREASPASVFVLVSGASDLARDHLSKALRSGESGQIETVITKPWATRSCARRSLWHETATTSARPGAPVGSARRSGPTS